MNFNDHLSLAQDRMTQIGVQQMIEALQKPGAIVRRGSFYDGGPVCVQVCYPGAKFSPSIVESQILPALASEIAKIENKPQAEPAQVVAPSVQAETPIQLGLFDVKPEPVKLSVLYLLSIDSDYWPEFDNNVYPMDTTVISYTPDPTGWYRRSLQQVASQQCEPAVRIPESDYSWQDDRNVYPFDTVVCAEHYLPYTCAICEQEVTVNIVHQNGRQFHEECYTRMEIYQQRVNARYARLLKAADKHEQESKRIHEYTDKVYGALNGTPVLIGHHSEKRHRRLLDKLWNMDGKAYEHYKTAEHLRQRAAAAKQNPAISSDDPAAVIKLKEKLAQLEAQQAHMVAVNKVIHKIAKRPKMEDAGTLYLGSPERAAIWKRNDEKFNEFAKGLPALAPKLAEMAGISETEARVLLTPDELQRYGYVSYQLSNNNAEIRRLRTRIEDLSKKRVEAVLTPETERSYGDIKVIENAADNRLQIAFPAKPSKDVIKALRSAGFHWSPTNGTWQRMLTNDARWKAEYVLKSAGVDIPE